MPRLTPGSFHGSMPSPDFEGARFARIMDLGLSTMVVLAGAGVWLGASCSWAKPDGSDLLALSSFIVLVAGLIGMWLLQRFSSVPRLSVTIWREHAKQSLAPRAAVLASEARPTRVIAGLAANVLAWLRGKTGSGTSTAAAQTETWEQAQQMLADLYREADFLDQASTGIAAEDSHLAGELGKAGAGCEAMQTALSCLTNRVAALTGAVGGTTAEAQQVVALSVSLSEQAFAGQRHVADLDDRSAALQHGVEQLEEMLLRLERLSGAGAAALHANGVAADLKSLAIASRGTIGALQADLADMSRQVESASRAARALGERVQSQQTIGLGLAHAVAQQGEEVGEILRILAEAQSGFLTLRESVQAVMRHTPSRAAKAEQLRRSAARLPAHAETLASVLRSLPDFAPPGASES